MRKQYFLFWMAALLSGCGFATGIWLSATSIMISVATLLINILK